MATTLGSYTTLPDPSEFNEHDEPVGNLIVMADGSLDFTSTTAVGTRRVFDVTFRWRTAAEYASLWAAYLAAILADKAFAITNVVTSLNVRAVPGSWARKVEPFNDSLRSLVKFTVKESDPS